MNEIGDIVKLRYSSPQYKNMCSIVDSEAKRKYYIKNGQILVGMTLEKHERIIKEKDKQIAGLDSTVRKYEELKKKIERRREELRSWQCKEADELTELLK